MLYAWILFAQEKAPVEGPGPFWFTPFILIAVGFLLSSSSLPARKEKKQRLSMMGALKKNDKIITSGGIIGVVVNLKEGTEEITIRSEDAKLLILRSSIARILSEPDKDPSTQIKAAT